MGITRTVQQTVNFASTQTELMVLAGVGGYTNEPALTIANNTLKEIFTEDLPWKWNRYDMPFFATSYGTQTYQFAGSTVFSLATIGKSAQIDLASNSAITESVNTVTVNTLEPHPFNIGDLIFMAGNSNAAYNSTFTSTMGGSSWSGGWTVTATPTPKSFQFVHATSGLPTDGAPGLTNVSWLESCSMVVANDQSFPQANDPLFCVRMLPKYTMVAKPSKIALISDLQNGIIKLRLDFAADQYPRLIMPVYQGKPPLIASLASTWTPIPDEVSYLYDQMFLAMAYRHINSPRADVEYQKAQALIQKAIGKEDVEPSEEYLVPTDPLNQTGMVTGPWWI